MSEPSDQAKNMPFGIIFGRLPGYAIWLKPCIAVSLASSLFLVKTFMIEPRVNRKLSAVLAADVVGYSRLMGADEVGTLAALKRHHEVVFDPAIAVHNGRIVKLIGDGTLVEFGSVIDAVNCALAVQRTGVAISNEEAPKPVIVLRIGINLGDVILESDDIYGDGVNIAARLEALAEPGGICVSSVVHESIGKRVDVSFRDGGEIHAKNIDRPIHIWTWHPRDAAATVQTFHTPNPAPHIRKSSIAVLPFTNMSGDPEQEFFSDGISEDIITDLSKISGLTVIARNSSFTYKGRAVDIRAVGRDLGVGTVLEGSVRRAGARLRITAQLIDAATGAHLWAERFDRNMSDLFEVQDDITSRIVEALKVTMSPSEKARVAGSGTGNIDAYDCFLRGRDLIAIGKTQSREVFEQARDFLLQAIELDGDYAQAYAALAVAYVLNHQNRWTADSNTALRQAKQAADRAIEKDPQELLARSVAALVATFEADLARAKSEAEIALTLNPNSTEAYLCLGNIYIFSGQPLEAIPLIEKAMRLDPTCTQQPLHLLGVANLLAGKYETAAALLKHRILMVPKTDFSRAVLASALGHLGEIEEAQRVWRELMEINPHYTFKNHYERQPFVNMDDVRRIADGLDRAGLLH
ncbi:adenylate/guanylate cyclase domain-containing protein [Bradyrhizobium sp. OAE829]|uniref:adenylate/guanylate cyclase domain-containing protein n=1 Tax=Bradyrhizobium sp. OAE829 TaxID=2663807 RepID=UPI00178A645A